MTFNLLENCPFLKWGFLNLIKYKYTLGSYVVSDHRHWIIDYLTYLLNFCNVIWVYDMVGKPSYSGHIYTYRGLITLTPHEEVSLPQ